VIELRGVVDRSEKAGQIIEEGVVAAADKGIDQVSARRLKADVLIGRDRSRKASAGKPDEAEVGPVVAIDRHPDLRRPQYVQILVFDRFQVGQQIAEAVVVSSRSAEPPVGRDQYAVQHVGIKVTGLRHRREGQGDDDPISAGAVGGRKAEDVVEVGGADVDIRKDRIDGIRIVMVCHNGALPCSAAREYNPPSW
jgi:hypothetical protein